MYRQPTRAPKSPDRGNEPYIIDIAQSAEQNQNFRAVVWTGKHLQTTLMSIPVGSDIGLEVHPTSDQFIYIECGRAKVMMGDCREKLDLQRNIAKGYAVQVPAGTWHNVLNTGSAPLKLFTIYAPPLHPKAELFATKAEAIAAERRAAMPNAEHQAAKPAPGRNAAKPAAKQTPAKPVMACPAAKPAAKQTAAKPAAEQRQAARPVTEQQAKPAAERPAAKLEAECPAAKR